MIHLSRVADIHTVRFEALVPGPIERVWDYLTLTAHLRTWLGDARIAERIGGPIYLGLWESPANTEIYGELCRYEPPHTLSYSWIDRSKSDTVLARILPDRSRVDFE